MTNNNYHNFNANKPLFPKIGAEAYGTYLDLMQSFWRSVGQHNGSSDANDRLVDQLVEIESHIKHLFDGQTIPYELEEAFFNSAMTGFDGDKTALPDTGDINLLLDSISKKFNARMLDLSLDEKEDEFFKELENGGAIVINHQDDIFVPTDPSRAHIMIGDGQSDNTPINQFAPKFADVITALRSIGIYTNDLVIHRGVVGNNMVRDAAYHLIQIPELDSEIAVCNRIGEVILVSNPIRGPHLFKTYDKAVLVKSLGVEPVRYKGDWQTRLCALILGDKPEERTNRPRADRELFVKSQTQPAHIKITKEMILIAMLECAKHSESGNELPAYSTPSAVLSLYGLTWKQIDRYAKKALNASLASIKAEHGLVVGRQYLARPIYQAVQNYYENGILPERKKIEIAPENILGAMLDHAAQSKSGYELPSRLTPSSALSLYGLTWEQIDSYAQNNLKTSLGQIKAQYGLVIWLQDLPQPIYQAVQKYHDHGILTEKKQASISRENILRAMLDYAVHSSSGCELPSQGTKSSSLSLYGLTWLQIDAFARKNLNTSLGQIKEQYGLEIGKQALPRPIYYAVQNYRDHRVLPEQKAAHITLKNILETILHYVSQPQSDYDLPSTDTEASSLSLYGLTWKQINFYARYNLKTSLARVKAICEFVVEGSAGAYQKINEHNIREAVFYYQEHKEAPPALVSALNQAIKQNLLEEQKLDASASPSSDLYPAP